MKKILRALLSLLVVFGIATFAIACGDNNETPAGPQDVELTERLASNDEGVYTVAAENGTANITCTKSEGKEWSALAAPIANTTGIQSLRFTVKGSCVVIFKIESKAGNKEVKLQLDSVSKAYEWDLTGADEQAILAGENFTVIVFVLPGLAEGTGEITISNFVLSIEEALYNPINSGYTNIKEDVNNYDGVSSKFNVNDKWKEIDTGTYTFEKTDNGLVVNYTKTDTYNYALSPVAGAFGHFEYITIIVTGTAGEKLLVKAEGTGVAKEVEFEFTGERQIVTLDLSELDEAARGNVEKVLIFAQPNVAEGSGQFTIHEMYYTTEYEGEKPVVEAPKYNAEIYWGPSNEGTWSPLWGAWYSGGNDVFAWNNDTKTVSFADRTDYAWSVFGVDVRGNLGDFSTLTWKVKATDGLLFKFVVEYEGGRTEYHAQETKGNGEEQTIVLDLTVLTMEQRQSIKRIGFFTGWQLNSGDTGNYFPAGEIQVLTCDFGGYNALNVSGADTFDVNHSFYDISNPTRSYTVTTADGVTTIEMDKKDNAYAGAMFIFSGSLEGYTQLKYDFGFGEGVTKVAIKIEGTKGAHEFKEATGISAAGAGTIDLTSIASVLTGANKVIIMVNFGEPTAKGTLTINTLEFVK